MWDASSSQHVGRAAPLRHANVKGHVAKPHVEAASAADLSVLQLLWRQMMDDHAAYHDAFALAEDANARWCETMRDMLHRGDSFVFKASCEGTVVGFCSGWSARNPTIYAASQVGLISELAVAVQARRRGVGAALVAKARQWFGARALHEFQLSTAVQNVSAREFWRAQGGDEVLLRFRFVLGEGQGR